jgi:hypothetical protein
VRLSIKKRTVRFEVLTVTIMKMAIFWDVAPFSLVDTERPTASIIIIIYRLHGTTSSKKLLLIPPFDGGSSQVHSPVA